MKTIAISIDEATLERALRHARRTASGKSEKRTEPNLSRFIREALRQWLDRVDVEQREHRDQEVLRVHRGRLQKQARALIAEQAKP